MSEKLNSGRVPVGSSDLVLRCYSRECDGDRERMLEMAMRDLWRNHPEWPSTFSGCFNADCAHNLPGRGGGLCAGCVTDCIGEITGNMDDAMRLRSAINQTRHLAGKLRDAVSSQNAGGMARELAAPDSDNSNDING